MRAKYVICVVVDRLRAAALGAYGAAWCETPGLDRLASQSFLFDHALVDRLDLDAVYRGFWQGLHGLAPPPIAAGRPSLPAWLGEQGIATILMTDEPTVADHALAADFDECVRLEASSETGSAASVEETQMARVFAGAVDLLGELDSDANQPPWLLWVHAGGMAGPWDAPLALRNKLADEEDPQPPSFTQVPERVLPADFDPDELLGITHAYTGQVMVLDRCIDVLSRQLEASPIAEDTLLVLAGARGFALGEHGRVGAADEALFGESLHVPLMLRFGAGTGKSSRSQALCGPFDLPATIAQWLDVEEYAVTAGGQSLLPIVRDQRDRLRDCLLMATPDGQRAVRTATWHLRMRDEKSELFAKPDDRWEVNDVADRCADVVLGLREAAATYEQAVLADQLAELPALDRRLVTPLE